MGKQIKRNGILALQNEVESILPGSNSILYEYLRFNVNKSNVPKENKQIVSKLLPPSLWSSFLFKESVSDDPSSEMDAFNLRLKSQCWNERKQFNATFPELEGLEFNTIDSKDDTSELDNDYILFLFIQRYMYDHVKRPLVQLYMDTLDHRNLLIPILEFKANEIRSWVQLITKTTLNPFIGLRSAITPPPTTTRFRPREYYIITKKEEAERECQAIQNAQRQDYHRFPSCLNQNQDERPNVELYCYSDKTGQIDAILTSIVDWDYDNICTALRLFQMPNMIRVYIDSNVVELLRLIIQCFHGFIQVIRSKEGTVFSYLIGLFISTSTTIPGSWAQLKTKIYLFLYGSKHYQQNGVSILERRLKKLFYQPGKFPSKEETVWLKFGKNDLKVPETPIQVATKIGILKPEELREYSNNETFLRVVGLTNDDEIGVSSTNQNNLYLICNIKSTCIMANITNEHVDYFHQLRESIVRLQPPTTIINPTNPNYRLVLLTNNYDAIELYSHSSYLAKDVKEVRAFNMKRVIADKVKYPTSNSYLSSLNMTTIFGFEMMSFMDSLVNVERRFDFLSNLSTGDFVAQIMDNITASSNVVKWSGMESIFNGQSRFKKVYIMNNTLIKTFFGSIPLFNICYVKNDDTVEWREARKRVIRKVDATLDSKLAVYMLLSRFKQYHIPWYQYRIQLSNEQHYTPERIEMSKEGVKAIQNQLAYETVFLHSQILANCEVYALFHKSNFNISSHGYIFLCYTGFLLNQIMYQILDRSKLYESYYDSRNGSLLDKIDTTKTFMPFIFREEVTKTTATISAHPYYCEEGIQNVVQLVDKLLNQLKDDDYSTFVQTLIGQITIDNVDAIILPSNKKLFTTRRHHLVLTMPLTMLYFHTIFEFLYMTLENGIVLSTLSQNGPANPREIQALLNTYEMSRNYIEHVLFGLVGMRTITSPIPLVLPRLEAFNRKIFMESTMTNGFDAQVNCPLENGKHSISIEKTKIFGLYFMQMPQIVAEFNAMFIDSFLSKYNLVDDFSLTSEDKTTVNKFMSILDIIKDGLVVCNRFCLIAPISKVKSQNSSVDYYADLGLLFLTKMYYNQAENIHIDPYVAKDDLIISISSTSTISITSIFKQALQGLISSIQRLNTIEIVENQRKGIKHVILTTILGRLLTIDAVTLVKGQNKEVTQFSWFNNFIKYYTNKLEFKQNTNTSERELILGNNLKQRDLFFWIDISKYND